LIFDEVVTGFRVAPGGAQDYFGIQADMATYGKIIGGGLPIGVLAGASTYMDALDGGHWQYGDASIPEVGVTFFAGTFVRHPLAIASANAVLQQLEAGGADLQRSLSAKVAALVSDVQAYIAAVQAPIQIHHFSSFFYVSYPAEVTYGSLLFYLLREKGIHIWEHRPCFLTLAHTDADIQAIAAAFKSSIAELLMSGLIPRQPAPQQVNPTPITSAPLSLQSIPHQNARLGRDLEGNPTWYIPDPQRPGQYLQLH
jgi:glutamate-1-semialdehyde aminotransferase